MLLSLPHPNKAHTFLHQTAITWKRSATCSSSIIYIKLRQVHMLNCHVHTDNQENSHKKKKKIAFFYVHPTRNNKPNSVISMMKTGSLKSKSMHNHQKLYQQISNTKVRFQYYCETLIGVHLIRIPLD